MEKISCDEEIIIDEEVDENYRPTAEGIPHPI